MTGDLNGGGNSATNFVNIDSNKFLIDNGPILTNAGDVAIGESANGSLGGATVGKLANSYEFGAAIGGYSDGSDYGAAVGQNANGKTYGVAVGHQASGINHGVAIGYIADGDNYGVAVGYNSSAVSNSVAIGQSVTNTEPNSTKLIGNLNMAGNLVTNAPNLIYTNTPAYTNTKALAAAALPASETNALSVTDLQITGLSGNGVVPVGAVMQYISSNAPAGWLLCDGSAVGTNVYSALFAVLGTTYGGATTNMNLPDLRGRVAVGMGAGPTLTERNLSATGGVETVTLTTSQMPVHSHGVSDAAYVIRAEVGAYESLAAGTDWKYEAQFTIDNAGGGASHENMPPYVILNYIIKY